MLEIHFVLSFWRVRTILALVDSDPARALSSGARRL